jgi:hypothetical protein
LNTTSRSFRANSRYRLWHSASKGAFKWLTCVVCVWIKGEKGGEGGGRIKIRI